MRLRGPGGDVGSTQIILLAAMVCAFGLTLLAVQVAQANDMRTRAQTAADAAAIGALTPLRDAAIAMAQQGDDPSNMGLWAVAPNIKVDDPVYNKSAREYADRNDALLAEKVEPSGLFGHTMKASVATKKCVIKKDDEMTQKDREDLAKKRNICTDPEGKVGIVKGRGWATAFAELRLPSCHVDYADAPYEDGLPDKVRLTCGDVDVWTKYSGAKSRGEIIRLFKIRLVAKEDPQRYNGLTYGGGADGFGQTPFGVGDKCPAGTALGPENITARMRCVRDQIKKLFKVPRGIGCYRPNGGIPGGGEHPLGRACDFMISAGAPNAGEVQLGYDISNWAVANAKDLGIYYVIYRQHIWNYGRSNEGWRPMSDRGNLTANHFDHVHISVYP